MNLEFTEINNKPENWPANETELQLDNIARCLKAFIKNPCYETKEILISLVSIYDLNQHSHKGLFRTTEYEVGIINSLFVQALVHQITPLRTYLYELVGIKTRMQKMVSWLPESNETTEIPEFNGLFPQLLLYHITYKTYILEKNKNYAEYLIEYAESVIAEKNSKLHIKFSRCFISLLNDISYFSCKRTSGIWAFSRYEIYKLFNLAAKLTGLSNQNPIQRPLKGVLKTCISNYILKSRNNYNEDYICKYVSPEVAEKSIENKEIWMSKVEKLNDEREQKVISELFNEKEWNTYKWAQNINFTPTRKYYVSSFSKSINSNKMKNKYGSCSYGYKNDKVAEMIAPIAFCYNQYNKRIPVFSEVISFDVIYDKEEAKEELNFLCKIIDCFEMQDEDKKDFLEEILQYWILSVKDQKWKEENERRYVIFMYDGFDYHETDLSNPEILKVKSSLLLDPDFVLGQNPVKRSLKSRVDIKRSNMYMSAYLYCENCLNRDFDKIVGIDKIKNCPICKSPNIIFENTNN